MLKTIVIGATTLFLAVGAASAASKTDLNNDGRIDVWEVHEFYSQEGGEYRR